MADVTTLESTSRLESASADAVSFLLSIQDIAPLDGALRSAAASIAT